MKTIVSRSLWILLGIVVLLGILWEFHDLPDAGPRLARLPMRSLTVESRNMDLTPAEREIFGKTTVVKRLVSVRGSRVLLTLIDGTKDRHAIHDPAFCFRGAGWLIDSSEPIQLERGEGRHLRLSRNAERAEAVFWFTEGDRQYAAPTRYWWRTAWRRLTLGRSGPEPVLVVLSSTEGTLPNWRRILDSWPELLAL